MHTNFPCSNCGAQLHVDGTSQTPMCNYCNTQTLLPEDVWQRIRVPLPPPVAPVAAPRPPKETDNTTWWIVGGGALFGVVSIIAVALGTPSSAATNGAPGDACQGRTAACTTDGKAKLHCGADDKLAIAMACKGPNGCRVSGTDLTCDYTMAALGDPCDVDDGACAVDHKAELRCVAGHFAVANACKGEGGCTLTPNGNGAGYTLSCDDHVADVGDPCAGSDRLACATNGKALLSCVQQKFAVARHCLGPAGCKATHNLGTENTTVDCDGSIGSVGDLCTEGLGACDAAGKAMLLCQNQKLVLAHHCPHGCTLGHDGPICR